VNASGLAMLSAMPDDLLERALLECCGSRRWVGILLEQRPFAGEDALRAAASSAFAALEESDWTDAFDAAGIRSVPPHPDAGIRAAAELALRLYADRFGHPFVAAGRQLAAEELLMRVRIRLGLEPDAELRASSQEVRRIAQERLTRLLERGAHPA
jgi:2-oxo-4-hydroxy-4-carboxy-5-ureidoimidazoline decarboxylase